ncbi:MAG: deoxyribonuclease IV [Desulfomonilaceae bacterium]|nr:deoxyribonuclease IV [Desulfomonilaceae bacterium]
MTAGNAPRNRKKGRANRHDGAITTDYENPSVVRAEDPAGRGTDRHSQADPGNEKERDYQANAHGSATSMDDLLIGAHMSIAGGIHRAITRGEALGCGVIQIFTKNASQWKSPVLTDQTVKKFTQERDGTGILVIAHDSYLINLASPDTFLRNRSIAAFVDEMERAEKLGIPYLVMHPGAHKDSGEEAGLKNIVRSFDAILKQTRGFRVRILVENTAGQGTALGHSFEQLKRIVEGTIHPERMGVCFDTCHAFAAGYDLRDRSGYERTMAELDTAVGMTRIEALHLNDSKKNLGLRVDRHEHIGRGMLGLECFRLIMNDVRFRGVPKVLETPKDLGGLDMDPVNLATLRNLVRPVHAEDRQARNVSGTLENPPT